VFVIDAGGQCPGRGGSLYQAGLGLLCMLDDNEHQGLESFEATPEGTLDDGSQVYSGS